ncbi:MAG: type II toxin-antitoxin system RelE/ParE family toxin [Mariprofundales bacterium]|nr:type II toxin-antitoxin system RelE/ParE family toxin [Mariprofundales bacterium]
MKRYRQIRVSELAKKELELIKDYTLKEWGKTQAQKYFSKIKIGFSSLRENPALGKSREEVSAGLFSYPVEKHIIFYRLTPAAMIVVRILHRRMDIPSILGVKS